MKKKVLAAAGIGAALFAGLSTGIAHADNFHGSRGDQDARAFWEDTREQINQPKSFAAAVCLVRSKGYSEAQAMSPEFAGNATVAGFVPAAEWHFCPQYYGN